MISPINILSLGAGTQSSALALMEPKPDCAIFADTKSEPENVYRWLDWLEGELPFPVYRVSAGSLSERASTLRTKNARSIIPTFMRNPDGSQGTFARQCTYDYKVMPLQREALRLMREAGASRVDMWIGISLDEVYRMKPNRHPLITNRWPLIEKRMTRNDCLRWMESHGYPRPPRSACIFCPYHSDTEWRRLRDEEPAEFADAVEFERKLQAMQSVTSNQKAVPYLHRSMVPLDEVDFSTDLDRGQLSLFGNECEGMCGV